MNGQVSIPTRHRPTIGHIFPLPSPYSEANQNWMAFCMWRDAATEAARWGRHHEHAAAEMTRLKLLPMEPCRELTLAEWAEWRRKCQADYAADQAEHRRDRYRDEQMERGR